MPTAGVTRSPPTRITAATATTPRRVVRDERRRPASMCAPRRERWRSTASLVSGTRWGALSSLLRSSPAPSRPVYIAERRRVPPACPSKLHT